MPTLLLVVILTNILRLITTLSGHTDAISSVGFSKHGPSFVVSVSEDRTLKLWSLSSMGNALLYSYACSHIFPLATKGKLIGSGEPITVKAHDKDINSVVVSPNDKFLATASQDKTVKV